MKIILLLLACFIAAGYAGKDDLTKEQEAEIIDIYKTVCPDPDKKSEKESEKDIPLFCKLSAKIIENAGKKNNPSDSETTTQTQPSDSESQTTTANPADKELEDESPSNSTTKYIEIFKLMCSNNLDKANEETPLLCKLSAKLVDKPENEKESSDKDKDAPENEEKDKEDQNKDKDQEDQNKDNDKTTTTTKKPKTSTTTTTTTKKPPSKNKTTTTTEQPENEDEPPSKRPPSMANDDSGDGPSSFVVETPGTGPDYALNPYTKLTYTRL